MLIPAVENAIAGNAMRPLDVFRVAQGTDRRDRQHRRRGPAGAGRRAGLADEEAPDLLIDLGTLTGAARVALGPDLPPFYTDDETLALDLARCAAAENDPLWRMPLWAPYDSWLDSKVADINNAPSGGFAGSITCALFLQRFVERAKSWLHVDIYGWTPKAKPGRPEGGECQAARAIYRAAERTLWLIARLTPARPDLAAKHLEGQVDAARFVAGEECEIVDGDRAAAPRPVARRRRWKPRRCSGERVTIYDRTEDGWAWGQLASDGYVGWLPDLALCAAGPAPTHKVTALRTFAFPGPSIKLPPAMTLPLGARLAIVREDGAFAVTADGLFVPRQHLAARDDRRDRFRRGRRALRRHALSVGRQDQPRHRLLRPGADRARPPAASRCPRDSDMQEAALGRALSDIRSDATAARRSDLLERPCRDRARRQQHRARQRASHGDRDRTDAKRRSTRIAASRQRG